MKTILRVMLATVMLSVSQAFAALPDATQAAVNSAVSTLNSTTATPDQKSAAIAAIKSLCLESEEEAGAIVAAVVAGLGGENANAAIVTELMTEVVSAFEGNPVIAESIVLAVINIAPNLVASIEASQGGFSGNPLNSLIPDGAIINTGDQQVTVNPPPPAS